MTWSIWDLFKNGPPSRSPTPAKRENPQAISVRSKKNTMPAEPQVIYRYKDDRSGKTADSSVKQLPPGWARLTLSATDTEGNEGKAAEYVFDADSTRLFKEWLASKQPA